MAQEELKLTKLRDGSGRGAVIFIHGVLSSTTECWTNKNGISWPGLLLSERGLEGFGVYTFDYETSLFSGGYSIDDAVSSLHEWLKSLGLLGKVPLVFVCHSMGGIIARRLVTRRAADFSNAPVGLFLVASPSLGSRYASMLSPVLSLFKHSQGSVLSYVDDNPWIESLDRDFKDMKEEGRVAVFGKELSESRFLASQPWISLGNIVTNLSAERYFGQPLKVAHADHKSISKPASADSIQHRTLCNFLKESELWRHRETTETSRKMTSEQWFLRIKEHLEDCAYARIYLHSFDHPDNFVEPHVSVLQSIIDAIRDRLQDGADVKIIAYTRRGKKSGADWLAEQLNDDAKVREHIRFNQTQKVANSTSMYLFDEKTVIYNLKRPGGDRLYHIDNYSNSIVHELMRVGFERLFVEAM
jgi:pimeloyl-ACP methyl ester carboxylesterase